MSIDLSQFIPTFLEESFEGLELMESSLLNLDAGDTETINAIFRAAHSIKGGAGTFGFTEISDFTHVVETLLDEMRSGQRNIEQDGINLLLQAVDCIRMLLEAARDGEPCEDDKIDSVQQQLQKMLSGEAVSESADETTAEPTEIEDEDETSDSGWNITFVPRDYLLQTGNEPVLMFAALEDLGELKVSALLDELPGFDALEPENLYLRWQMELVSDCSEADVREVFEWIEDDCDLEVTPLTAESTDTRVEDVEEPPALSQPATDVSVKDEKAETTKAADTKPAAGKNKPVKAVAGGGEGASIRVSIDKVDALINRVGELVITQSMLSQVGLEIEELEVVEQSIVERLKSGMGQLERNTRDLQEDVMRVRMLPISFVFNRFPRMVHDVSSKLGKKVELKLSGEQTELDKTVMEKLGDPLVHLVRNSLDHGLEPPEERAAAGKDETGTVSLNAYHQGGYIVIEIIDDGRGLNTERILAKAIENGLVSEDQQLTDSEIHELIFQPGFSTAAEVSDLSGRGVGMDVVRRNIESLGGHVSVQSEPGHGSTFSVSLPLTLAILDGQLVRSGTETYIVPLVSIIESMQISAGSMNALAGEERLLHFRDEYIPLLQLKQLFNLPGETHPLENSLMIVLETGGQKFGLVVDELMAQQQVVIKGLETNYKRVPGLSGATILGDGSVALILDIAGLTKLGFDRRTLAEAQERTAQAELEQEGAA